MRKSPALMRKEAQDAKDAINKTDEQPGELVMLMTKDDDDSRKPSNVRWSNMRDIFKTGNYPQLGWNLYDCHPNEDRSVPPKPEAIFRSMSDLGHGSFGKVKLVEVKLTGERLAMKEMDKTQCPKALRTKELHAYIQIGLSPFIVRFHSCFQTQDACYILLQYHCGGSLAKIIEEFGYLSECTARFFTAEVVEGLLHLHNRGIIHRDIKLANILLGVDNHVRICDMGLCKLGMTGKAKTHTRCGALRYCAPEVLAREWYSKEVDWWSLGVVLYRLLTGQYPFDGDTREHIESMIKSEEPNLDLVPSGPTRDIIEKFLVKTSSKRLGTGDYADALIRQHPYFNEINWQYLQSRKLKAPSVQKRFMRRGSIIRKLAFGTVDLQTSRARRTVRLCFNFLFRLVILTAIAYGIAVYNYPELHQQTRAIVEPYYQQLRAEFDKY